MPVHTATTGERIEYTASPPLADFFARARIAAADPTVGIAAMVELLYGEENPLLTRGVLPGRGYVTREVLEDPAYRVMLDLLDQKRVQARTLDPGAAVEAHTVSVADAAKQLGISGSAVRQAIAAGRLPAVKISGQHWMQPAAIASYRVTRRGPPPAEARAPALRVTVGTEGNGVLQVRHDGVMDSVQGTAGVAIGEITGWTWCVVKLARKDRGSMRLLFLEPGQEAAELTLGSLSVRGRFRVARRVNNAKAAAEAWRAVR